MKFFLVNKTVGFLITLICSFNLFAETIESIPEGLVDDSPYESCSKVVIVEADKYQKNRVKWDEVQKRCHLQIQLATDAGFTAIDPLKEGVQYLDFSSRVAKKVIENLVKSQQYTDCSAACFSGASTCSNGQVICKERKEEVKHALNIFTNKIRMELALSKSAPGPLDVNVRNVLAVDKSKRINTNLADFEIGTPNPVGRIELSDRESREALRRLENERKALEEEFKTKKAKNYNEWMSLKLMEKYEEHQAKYRQLIYEEAPIFAVLDRPTDLKKGEDPVWSDEQIAKAFKKLSSNATATKSKVEESLKKSKLEFSRATGEAAAKWLATLAPGVKDQHDLLYYISMKNQVEDVLKNDPSYCGVATTLFRRMNSKALQNAGVTLVGFLGGMTAVRGISPVFRIGRALSGAESAGLTGLALGSVFVGDSFRQFNLVTREATTRSGVSTSKKEGEALRTGEEVDLARTGIKLNLAFAPLDVVGGWAGGKILYSSLSKQMTKDIPSLLPLIKRASKNDTVARDQAVDKWIGFKLKAAFKDGIITKSERELFDQIEARKVLDGLIDELSKSNPEFFNNPTNMDFVFKTAATMLKREADDPVDLGRNAQAVLARFSKESVDGSWGELPQKALLKVFDNTITELRIASKNDPVTYLKFSSDKDAQESIFINALRRSGAKEEDLEAMRMCALR